MRTEVFRPAIVESTPNPLEPGVLYISERFKTVIHLCPCGCGEKVVTPLNPAAWHLKMHNGLATLHPSVGNWSMNCKSHYFIRANRVVWTGAISKQAIKKVFAADQAAQSKLFQRRVRKHPLDKALKGLWNWLCGR